MTNLSRVSEKKNSFYFILLLFMETTTLEFEGNKAAMELFHEITKLAGPTKAADAVGMIYQGCGSQGYVLPSRG